MSIIIIHCHAFLKIKGLVIVQFCYVFLSYFQGARLSLLDNGSINFKSSFSTKGGWVAVNECYYFKNKQDPKRPVQALHIHLDKQRCTQDSGQYFQVKVLLEGSKHCCAR